MHSVVPISFPTTLIQPLNEKIACFIIEEFVRNLLYLRRQVPILVADLEKQYFQRQNQTTRRTLEDKKEDKFVTQFHSLLAQIRHELETWSAPEITAAIVLGNSLSNPFEVYLLHFYLFVT